MKSVYPNLHNQQPRSQAHSDISITNSLVHQSGCVVTINYFLLTEEISVEEVLNAVNAVKKGNNLK